ncbi:MAG: hypothetical protein AB1736_14515 [Chloroflexota bacterium]
MGSPTASSGAGGVLVDGLPGGPGESGELADGGSVRWLTDIAAPLGYAVLVLGVAFVIARRRLARREQAALAGAAAAVGGRTGLDLDTRPLELPQTPPEHTIPDDEANLPRWLRPSLRAERAGLDLPAARTPPVARHVVAPPARAPLAFGGVPTDLDDRRVVRIAGAALLDRPDEATGQRVLELEPGDEVAILDRENGWLNVLTPTGVAGWLSEAQLPDATGAVPPPASRPEPAVGPVPGSPVAAPDEPLDLAALLAAGRPDGQA